MNISASLMLVLSALLVIGCGSAEVSGSTTAVAAASATTEDPTDVHLDGDHVTIDRHINFAVDSDEILSDSNDLLDHIAQFLANHSAQIAKLKIVGHTDAAGEPEHNQDLSNRRAAAVAAALTTRGVTIALEHAGAGESEHLCQEDTEECHAKNRRVEFLVIAD